VKVLAAAPGRVNLIGDHTDYTGGLVCPMAIDRTTQIEFDRGVPWVELVSDADPDPTFLPLESIDEVEPRSVRPVWARYVAGVMWVLRPEHGGTGFITSTVPLGQGLSSSAALEVAVALALGFEGTPLELAQACQQAEHVASGVPCGIMDQLTAAAAVAGCALRIDCESLDVDAIPMPDDAEVIVASSGQTRSLTAAPYGVRRAQCDDAAALIGPLRAATLADVAAIAHDDLRRRARHVVTENQRVVDFTAALRSGDLRGAGQLMVESHASLRDDFEVSTRRVDALVDHLGTVPGVYGARITGAGFGGCVVALAAPGTDVGVDAWRVRPSGPATVIEL
jgi:galactokinase